MNTKTELLEAALGALRAMISTCDTGERNQDGTQRGIRMPYPTVIASSRMVLDAITPHLAAENVKPEPGDGKAPFGYVGYNKAQSCWEFESEREGFEGAEYVTSIRPVFTAPPAQADDAKDAARYRWLRDATNQPDILDDFDGIIIQAGYVGGESILLGGDLDAAIDAAMSAERKE